MEDFFNEFSFSNKMEHLRRRKKMARFALFLTSYVTTILDNFSCTV